MYHSQYILHPVYINIKGGSLEFFSFSCKIFNTASDAASLRFHCVGGCWIDEYNILTYVWLTMVELPFHAADYDGTVSLWGVPSPVVLPREHSHRSSVFLPSKMSIVSLRSSSHWVPVELPRKLICHTVELVIKNIRFSCPCPVNYFTKVSISFYYSLWSNFESNLDHVFCILHERTNEHQTHNNLFW